MDTETNAAFLRAICENPDDDAVRLVYADWLEENGRAERAEFIRVQIELASMAWNALERERLAEREDELFLKWSLRWKAEEVRNEPCNWGRWSRGFIDEVNAYTPEQLMELSVELIPIRRLSLINWSNYESLRHVPFLGRFTELSIQIYFDPIKPGQFADKDFEEILSIPQICQFTQFYFFGYRFSTKGIQKWSNAKLPHLRSVSLKNGWCYDSEPRDPIDLSPLLQANWIRQLDHFELDGVAITPDFVARLCEQLRQGRCRSLVFSRVEFGDDAADELVRSGILKSLIRLDLSQEVIGLRAAENLVRHLSTETQLSLTQYGFHADLEEMINSPTLHYVDSIVSDGPSVNDRNLIALANSPQAAFLERISLTGGEVRHEGVRALLASPHLRRLQSIYLDRNKIEALPACRLPKLTILSVNQNCLTSKGVEAFFRDSHLPNLHALSLSHNRIGPEAASILANSQRFLRLRTLHLEGNPLGDEGAKALTSGNGLAEVQTIRLVDCQISEVGVAALLNASWFSRWKTLEIRGENSSIASDVWDALCLRANESQCELR